LIRDELASLKQFEREATSEEHCDICNEQYVGYIMVEDNYKQYCFNCYNRDFGHERFMRRYREMDDKMKNEGFDKL